MANGNGELQEVQDENRRQLVQGERKCSIVEDKNENCIAMLVF